MSPFTLECAQTRLPRRTGFLMRFRHAIALRRQRRALLALDDHLLSDIGLTRTEAEAAARLPFWDAPDHWTRRTPANRGGMAETSGFSDGNA